MTAAIQRQAKFSAMLLGLIVLAGCGSAGSGGSSKAPPPTATLTANPSTITEQGFSTLSFSSTNADSGVIDNGVGQGLNGQRNVSPSVTTTYTFTVSGPGGSASAQATVTVTPPPPPPTITLTVTPAEIFPGQSITFTWQSTNATNVVIDNVGPVTPVSSGSETPPPAKWPTQTTTYTAVATGNNQQATATATVTVSPVTSFDGMLPDSSNDGPTDTKIDPNGAVGTKQFMEYVNTEYQAFDKKTFQPVLPPSSNMFGQAIGTPWATAFPKCAGTGIALDAVINFDRLASRWVIAGKAVRQSGTSEEYYFCIAVSNIADASDPNFSWYAYGFSLNQTLAIGTQFYFPDWPKLGTWPDAYYATMDMLDPNGNDTESGVAVCAFDRNSMLSGGTAKNPQCFTDTSRVGNNGLYLAHSLIPADFDGTTPPPAGRDEFLVSIENPVNDLKTTTSTTFNLWDFHVDWSNPTNSTLTVTPISVTPPYTPGCYLWVSTSPAITNCVNEPPYEGSGQHIDSVGDRFMPRFAYRNFGSYESFLVSHTVKTAVDQNNPNQTGINWYELRGSGTPSLFQSGTINPDNSLFRFLPSIAQDKVGNVAVGYNVSNNFTDPGIDFSYWNLATPSAPIEISILNGTGEEVTPTTGTGNWGTYSSMTVDPADDCTFWYVNEYWPTNATWATRITYFKMPNCVP